ncbi:hypothetical protein L204_101311 [Cryptococcus depauperatus]
MKFAHFCRKFDADNSNHFSLLFLLLNLHLLDRFITLDNFTTIQTCLMPRYIPLSLLPSQTRAGVRILSSTPLVNPLRQLPSPSTMLLSRNDLPPNVRVQEWVDGRGRWFGVSQRDRLGGKKRVNTGLEAKGRRWGGLKWAMRER